MTKAGKAIAVVGDLMCDRFVYGDVSRISPEAPVPVLNFGHVDVYAGGCGNVAVNLAAMGANVKLAAGVGRDAAAEELSGILDKSGIDCLLVKRDSPTTVKTRFASESGQHMLRLDVEDRHAPPFGADAAIQWLESAGGLGHVLVSDYGKGFVDDETARAVLDFGERRGVPVLVDTKRTDWSVFRGAYLVKPNFREFCLASGRSFDKSSPGVYEDVFRAAEEMCAAFGIGNILVTMGELGMVLAQSGFDQPVVAKQLSVKRVYDVSGAGDTVFAAVSRQLAEGVPLENTLAGANYAASVAVSRRGTSVVGRHDVDVGGSRKICKDAAELAAAVGAARAANPSAVVGFTNGCFDCCHYGHLSSLKEARRNCDLLVVAVNSDEWIRAHKGPGRPLQDENTRLGVLASFQFVDYVVPFSEETPAAVIDAVRPDVLMKQGYAREDWPEAAQVERYGGKVVELRHVDGYSTTNIVEKARKGTVSGFDI